MFVRSIACIVFVWRGLRFLACTFGTSASSICKLGVSQIVHLFLYAFVLSDVPAPLLLPISSSSMRDPENRDVVTKIVHNHINTATPMDVHTHITTIEKEKEVTWRKRRELRHTRGRSRQREARIPRRGRWTHMFHGRLGGKMADHQANCKGDKKIPRSMLRLCEDGSRSTKLLE